MKKILFGTFFLMLAASTVFAGEHSYKPYTGSAPFEKLKTLEGKWTGTVLEGGTTEWVPTQVVYEVSSGKTALVEKLFAGTPEEMVSVYNDEKGELVMTHYCLMQNQPKLKLKSADDKKIELEMFEANGVTLKDDHMHALTITFDGPDSITQKWRGYKDGKLMPEATVVKLKRA